MVKAGSIGVTMNKKVKRIGCSNMKDLVEQSKLEIVDSETILEMSTFVARGSSFEASDNNHDDLVMNLVMFGWFITTPFFGEMSDIDIKGMLYEEQLRAIEQDMLPFGFMDDGKEEEVEVDSTGQKWTVESNTGLF